MLPTRHSEKLQQTIHQARCELNQFPHKCTDVSTLQQYCVKVVPGTLNSNSGCGRRPVWCFLAVVKVAKLPPLVAHRVCERHQVAP